MADKQQADSSQSLSATFHALSEREKAVIDHALKGLTAKQSADTLGLDASTVAEYRRRAYAKLSVANLKELQSTYGHEEQPLVATKSLSINRDRPAINVRSALSLLVLSAICLATIALFPEFAQKTSSANHDTVFLIALVLLVPLVCLLFIAAVISIQKRPMTETIGIEDFAAKAYPYLRSKGFNNLTAKILIEIAEGKSTKDIEKQLHVAKGTVNAARAKGYLRLEVHSQTELAKKLLRAVKPGIEDLL